MNSSLHREGRGRTLLATITYDVQCENSQQCTPCGRLHRKDLCPMIRLTAFKKRKKSKPKVNKKHNLVKQICIQLYATSAVLNSIISQMYFHLFFKFFKTAYNFFFFRQIIPRSTGLNFSTFCPARGGSSSFLHRPNQVGEYLLPNPNRNPGCGC